MYVLAHIPEVEKWSNVSVGVDPSRNTSLTDSCGFGYLLLRPIIAPRAVSVGSAGGGFLGLGVPNISIWTSSFW